MADELTSALVALVVALGQLVRVEMLMRRAELERRLLARQLADVERIAGADRRTGDLGRTRDRNPDPDV